MTTSVSLQHFHYTIYICKMQVFFSYVLCAAAPAHNMYTDRSERDEVMTGRIIDISQEVFSCKVFPGDPKPSGTRLMSMDRGDVCNLTQLSMCAHNGTHVDAPYHFINHGRTIDRMGLEPFVGDCFVARHSGDVTADDARSIMEKAAAAGAAQRILIAGKAVVTAGAARVFAQDGIMLLGNESQTVGPEDSPKEVHLILLGSGAVLLEGIVLSHVEEGRYFLSAAPLDLGGCDGAPCRAYLIGGREQGT